MIKDILVHLTVDAKHDTAAAYAVSVAAAFEAHASGVAFAYDPYVPGTVFDGVAASLIATYRNQNRNAAESARRNFEESAQRAGLTVEAHVVEASHDGAASVFARMARCHDLAIVGQARPEDTMPEEMIIETTLFASGRPVLVVPYIQKAALKLDRVMVCWDGSQSAARAVADAMPVLRRAGGVDVVTVEQKEHRNELLGADIAQHLARHGLKVELKPIVSKETDVTNTILSYVADSSADLIVMGGYGHSRLREIVLGGVTRGVLGSMTVPTLMAH